jgi:uncharacterized cupredoxin-like copper-binding protein
MTRKALVAAVAVLSILTLVACGSKAESNDSPKATAGVHEVAVTLDDYAIRPAATTLAAGEVTFKIENVGATEHEMVVVLTDVDPADMPVVKDVIDEEAPGMEPIGEVEGVQPGASTELVLTLEAGNYVLLCNLEKHFGRGMVTTIQVA